MRLVAEASRKRGSCATCRSRPRPTSSTPGRRRPWPRPSAPAGCRARARARPWAVRGSPCASKRPSAGPRLRPGTPRRLGEALEGSRSPRSASSNRPPSSRRVAWLITTLPGAAAPAAAPQGSASRRPPLLLRAAPSPISSPTTTRPVAMPTRAAVAAFRRARRSGPSRAPQCAHRLDQFQPGPHRPLGLVLVRLPASRSRRARRRP